MLSLFDLQLAKRLRKRIKVMAKNMRKKGKSVRNGNSPSPYTKYGKRPHQYSQSYNSWKNDMVNNRRGATAISSNKQRGVDKRTLLQAAE